MSPADMYLFFWGVPCQNNEIGESFDILHCNFHNQNIFSMKYLAADLFMQPIYAINLFLWQNSH